jgi:tetratricopeptide (TPR) repeat protein
VRRAARRPAWGVLLLSACSGAAADHETLGDRAYLNRQFPDAFVEYRLALKQRPANGRLHAKAGAAALHVGDLAGAAGEYVALGQASPERRPEAADGLERVARAALTSGDRPALAAALTGLRQISAGRALGSFAGQMARGLSDANPAEAIAVLPFAAAAAPDARAQDSLVLQYARALGRAGECAQAVPVFEALVRRGREPAVARAAELGFLQCAVVVGRAAFERGAADEAESWYRRAALEQFSSPLVRAAYLGLGDVMRGRNDLLGAADAYQRAVQGAPPGDSVGDLARTRLEAIANAGTGGL